MTTSDICYSGKETLFAQLEKSITDCQGTFLFNGVTQMLQATRSDLTQLFLTRHDVFWAANVIAQRGCNEPNTFQCSLLLRLHLLKMMEQNNIHVSFPAHPANTTAMGTLRFEMESISPDMLYELGCRHPFTPSLGILESFVRKHVGLRGDSCDVSDLLWPVELVLCADSEMKSAWQDEAGAPYPLNAFRLPGHVRTELIQLNIAHKQRTMLQYAIDRLCGKSKKEHPHVCQWLAEHCEELAQTVKSSRDVCLDFAKNMSLFLLHRDYEAEEVILTYIALGLSATWGNMNSAVLKLHCGTPKDTHIFCELFVTNFLHTFNYLKSLPPCTGIAPQYFYVVNDQEDAEFYDFYVVPAEYLRKSVPDAENTLFSHDFEAVASAVGALTCINAVDWEAKCSAPLHTRESHSFKSGDEETDWTTMYRRRLLLLQAQSGSVSPKNILYILSNGQNGWQLLGDLKQVRGVDVKAVSSFKSMKQYLYPATNRTVTRVVLVIPRTSHFFHSTETAPNYVSLPYLRNLLAAIDTVIAERGANSDAIKGLLTRDGAVVHFLLSEYHLEHHCAQAARRQQSWES